MRSKKPLLALLLATCASLSAQNLYDLVLGSSAGHFTTIGAAVPTYTYESRFKAATNVALINAGLFGGIACGTDGSYNFRCISGGEQTPSGGPGLQLTSGGDYRFRFQHDATGKTITLTIWSGNCTQVYTGQYPIPTPLSLPMASTFWSVGPSYQVSFSRLYTGTNTSGACPTDAPATPANLWDFRFENITGSAGSLADRSGNGYVMTASGSSFAISAVYPPLASVAGWTTPKPVFRAGQPMTLTASASQCLTFPGTGACSSYLWTAVAGPQLNAMTPQMGVNGTFTPPIGGQYTFQLTVTDNTGARASLSQNVGVVATDANSIVIVPNASFQTALGTPLMHGQSPWPWFEVTEAAVMDMMSQAVQAPIHEVAGTGTCAIPSSGPNNLSTGSITGSIFAGVAWACTGSNFSVSDLGNYVVLHWDADGDSSYQGRFVQFVAQLGATEVNGSAGTALNKLVKLSSGNIVTTATTDTSGAIGVLISGAGTSGNGFLLWGGNATCTWDNTPVAGDYVQISSITAGDCHDAGASLPGSGQVIGTVFGGSLVALNLAQPSAGTINVASTTFNIQEPFTGSASVAASGLTWTRIAQGSGTCTGLTATVSGGQVTGIAGAGGCSGFYWWAYFPPTVTFTGGGGTGCNVTAALIAYPAAGAGGISGFNGLPCGSGYTSAPSVTVTAYSDWKPYNMQDQLSQIFNFYEAGLAIGRFWQRTQLTAYQAEFHGFCTNTWRWSLDSGYTSAVPRNLGLDLILACATDPSWTPPSGMSAEIAGVARITMNSAGSAYTSFTGGTTPVYNPTTDILPALIDPRETSYLTRWSAKLAQLTTGSTQTAWCGYLANQITHMWLVDAAIPSGDTTGSKFFPENLFFNNQSFPAAGVPPVTGPFGTSPWRDGGLPAIALSDSYTALSGPCANATVAAQLHNAAGTGLVDGVANFAWNYSRAPDGGTFYAGAYASNTQGGFPAIWNTFVNGLQTGSVTASGTAVTGVGTYFTRVFCPAGACNLGMQINGTNYTVAAVASDTSLTLTSSAGTVASTGNFGSTCVLNVTNGSTAVTGTGCKFSAMFGAFSPWIYGAGVYAGIISPNDKNVYGVTVNSDSSATLNTAFVDAGCASGCSLGSFTVVPVSPNGVQFCGGDSLFTYCNPDPFSGRNLSQDLCYIYAWMYQQTSNVIWRSHTDQCYNKIYGGAAGGSGAFGAPTGASLYNRPGVITVSQGSPMVAGAGTQFTQQFTRGSQITIGDGTASGNTWASPPGANPTFYTLTVATVDSDRSLTLTGNYPGTGASATAMFYNPSDPQWSGADGGAGNLGETLPFCQAGPPCGAGYFNSMYGKPLGMASGAGNVPVALASRLGGAAAPVNRAFAVAFDLAAIPHATQVTVSITGPDESVAANTCSTSPCVVTTTAQEGAAEISIQYKSASGEVLSSSAEPVFVALH